MWHVYKKHTTDQSQSIHHPLAGTRQAEQTDLQPGEPHARPVDELGAAIEGDRAAPSGIGGAKLLSEVDKVSLPMAEFVPRESDIGADQDAKFGRKFRGRRLR